MPFQGNAPARHVHGHHLTSAELPITSPVGEGVYARAKKRGKKKEKS